MTISTDSHALAQLQDFPVTRAMGTEWFAFAKPTEAWSVCRRSKATKRALRCRSRVPFPQSPTKRKAADTHPNTGTVYSQKKGHKLLKLKQKFRNRKGFSQAKRIANRIKVHVFVMEAIMLYGGWNQALYISVYLSRLLYYMVCMICANPSWFPSMPLFYYVPIQIHKTVLRLKSKDSNKT